MQVKFLRFRLTRTILVSLMMAAMAWSFLPRIAGTAVLANSTDSVAPVINAASPVTMIAESVTPANGTADPDEVVTMSFPLINAGPEATMDLVATLLPGGGVTPLNAPQRYGALSPGDSAVAREFTFAAQGQCGGNLTATFQLTDAGADRGTVSFAIPLTAPAGGGTTIVSNPASIKIPGTGSGSSSGAPASPFPSAVDVSGVTGTVTKVTATITGLNHTFPGDIDMLLVGPGGQKVLLMSDVGDAANAVNANITFDDAANPMGATVVSGTFRPTNLETAPDNFPQPAPAGPYGTALSVFNGVDPNGTWRLYVVDDVSSDVGNINGGWSLSITTQGAGSGCAAEACTLRVADITTSNDAGQSGAVVHYPILPNALTSIGVVGSCGIVSSDLASGSFFTVGTTTVIVRATPSSGPAISSSFNVTVTDIEAPVISNVSISQSLLGPPDHKLVPVQVNYTVVDNSATSGNIATTLTAASNEEGNGKGDGNTASDWEILGPHDVLLRAERSGKGNGRRYTITITATDQAGNSTTAETYVDVAHN